MTCCFPLLVIPPYVNSPLSLFSSGVRLQWDGVSFLELSVNERYRGRLCGLCGNFNGDESDDLSGHVDGQSFGNTWRVGGFRACSVLPRDMPHSYQSQCKQTWQARIASDRNCNALRSTLFEKCAAAGVDPEFYYNACKLDMCECPGEQCHCEVLTAYARKCERAGALTGVEVDSWRRDTGCVNVTSFVWKAAYDVVQSSVSTPPEDEGAVVVGSEERDKVVINLQGSINAMQWVQTELETSFRKKVSPIVLTKVFHQSDTALPVREAS